VTLLERRWFVALLGHTFLLQVIVMLLRIAMTYKAVAIGLDALWIGLIGSAFGAVPAVLALYAGRAIDRLGEPAALAAASVMALVAAFGLWLAPPSALGLLLLSTATGFSQFIGVAGQHSAAGKTARERQAASFGHVTLMISLAHMIGPLLFGLLAGPQALPDTGPVVLAACLASLVMLAGTPLIRGGPRWAPPAAPAGMWATTGTIVRTQGYIPATLASLALFAAMDLLVLYLPLFGAERGLSPATVGLLLALRGAASVVSRLFFGRLYHGMPRQRLLVLALLGSGVAIALIPLVASPIAMGALAFVAGLGLGIGAPLTLAWIGEIIPASTLGSALSLRLAVNRAGQAVLPVAVGTLAVGLGAGGVIAVIGAALLVSGAVAARRGGG
jgi:MFS family permease